MIAVADSTVIFHFNYRQSKIIEILNNYQITQLYITRINYLEILAGASENAKNGAKKLLQQFPVIEFTSHAIEVANRLAKKYRIGSKQQRDFLIASIAIANKLPLLTENNRDFAFTEIKLLPYKIAS